ncbi:hypothetical protein [Caballeronia sp. BR00000012568055]|uniref:hypothetical protein n=1 Tax=Caballeronia sp. BR00000012568055 TaxID=2918761 RepID=UPI0023F80CBE|nr:hypothetical protein [Caballeronia sp. BR00000012568055]
MADWLPVAREGKLASPIDEGAKMRGREFQWMSRLLLISLPVFMGAVEHMLRVALHQPDHAAFFPISLAAAGVSLDVAVTVVPRAIRRGLFESYLSTRQHQAIFIAKLGVFASLGGTLLWLYLLMASFSNEVSAILPLHPYRDAVLYYLFSSLVTEWNTWANGS